MKNNLPAPPLEFNPWRGNRVAYRNKFWTVGSRVGTLVWLRDEFGNYMLVELKSLGIVS